MCGIIGIFGTDNISRQIFHGLQSLQHRGHSAVGMVTYDGNIYSKKEAGLVNRLMHGYTSETELEVDHPGYVGIGHTRYSTAGSDDWTSLKKNAQPEYIVNPFIAACHNGNIYNGAELMPKCTRVPRTDCDIQYLLLLMANGLPSFRDINFDTIVEAGTNIKKIINKLRAAGAKKVHVRIGCPPLIAPCYLGIDMRSKKEFIAIDEKGGFRSWDKIAEEIGADSLAYSSIDALKSIIIGNGDDFDVCTGCLDFPNGYPPDMREDILELYGKSAEGKRAYE